MSQTNQSIFSTDQNSHYSSKNIIPSLKSQWNCYSQRRFLLFKLLISASILILAIINSNNTPLHHKPAVFCLKDRIQHLTLPITLFFETNISARNLLLIVSSFAIDVNFIALGYCFIFYSNSIRTPLLIVAYYMFRAFIQGIFFMPYPEHYIFQYPGFFSLTVPYMKSNDFFFSGHIGVCTLFLLEFRRQSNKVFQCFAAFAMILNAFTLLITRAHYSIDLIVGTITAHYMYRLSLAMEQNYYEESDSLYTTRNLISKGQIAKEIWRESIDSEETIYLKEKDTDL